MSGPTKRQIKESIEVLDAQVLAPILQLGEAAGAMDTYREMASDLIQALRQIVIDIQAERIQQAITRANQAIDRATAVEVKLLRDGEEADHG